MAKLMVSVRRFLPLYAVIPFLLAGIAAQPAHAKLGPISIRTVYTTDENENYKTPFAAGDRINYHVDVDNTTSGTFPIKIRFRVVANDYSPDPRLYHYDQTYSVDQMPVGLSRFYNPATLPSDAANYFYAVQITITRSNCQGVDCDNDYAESTFTIKSPSSNFIYNGSIAAQWADAYAYSVRSDYSHHTQGGDYENVKGGTDCTNFASNAMYNGGFKMDDQWWSYSVGGVWKAGHAWGGTQNLFDYLLSTGYGQLIGGDHVDAKGHPHYLGYQKVNHPTNGLAPGDLVFFSWGNNAGTSTEGIAHMAIQTFRDKGSDRVDAHTADRQGVFWTLEEFWKDDPDHIPDPNKVAIYTMHITNNKAIIADIP